MAKRQVSLAELTTTTIHLLCREIGAVNTARFLNQFATGFGDYTAKRKQIVGKSIVNALVAAIDKRKPNERALKKSAPKPSAPTKRSGRRER